MFQEINQNRKKYGYALVYIKLQEINISIYYKK